MEVIVKRRCHSTHAPASFLPAALSHMCFARCRCCYLLRQIFWRQLALLRIFHLHRIGSNVNNTTSTLQISLHAPRNDTLHLAYQSNVSLYKSFCSPLVPIASDAQLGNTGLSKSTVKYGIQLKNAHIDNATMTVKSNVA